jgi:hypothetical protein
MALAYRRNEMAENGATSGLAAAKVMFSQWR